MMWEIVGIVAFFLLIRRCANCLIYQIVRVCFPDLDPV